MSANEGIVNEYKSCISTFLNKNGFGLWNIQVMNKDSIWYIHILPSALYISIYDDTTLSMIHDNKILFVFDNASNNINRCMKLIIHEIENCAAYKAEIVSRQNKIQLNQPEYKNETQDMSHVQSKDEYVNELELKIKKLEYNNDELKCVNEKLECVNEKLENNNKKLECVNEKLECVNEKLENNNKELEHRVAELSTQCPEHDRLPEYESFKLLMYKRLSKKLANEIISKGGVEAKIHVKYIISEAKTEMYRNLLGPL